jgi:hypothetical protein
VLYFVEFWEGNLCFVGEIKAELRWRDEGALLIDVVAENFAEGEIEDVGGRVVVSNGPAS